MAHLAAVTDLAQEALGGIIDTPGLEASHDPPRGNPGIHPYTVGDLVALQDIVQGHLRTAAADALLFEVLDE